MMKMTVSQLSNKDKYKPYHLWEKGYKERLEKIAEHSIWRQKYHIQPRSGLLNDPNGFSYYNGKWHLFYQSYPFGTIHGLKSWYHVESKDLISWEEKGAAIVPDGPFDSHGAYSGSAIPAKDGLKLFYTGNVRSQDWERRSYQLGAVMDLNGAVAKNPKPLIAAPPKGYTQHFRDPQVFRFEDCFYMILGAQKIGETGEILIYRSVDLEDWELLGPLNFTDQTMGYMIECPHLVGLTKTPILLFCPQGLDQSLLAYDNLNPNCYLIGEHFDLEKGEFQAKSFLKNLDDGFDVYATQAIDAPDGRTLAVSWLGLPESQYPVCKDKWTNCLSLVKELTVIDGELHQYPVEELQLYKQLIHQSSSALEGKELKHQLEENCYEYELLIEEGSGTLHLFSDSGMNRSLAIRFDTAKGTVTVDRSMVGERIKESNSIRQTSLPPNKAIKMNIFVDFSSIEIFFNDGIKVLSALVFPQENDTYIGLEGRDACYIEKLYLIGGSSNVD
ncbi:sucrose-6-phosphate hydrolase [Enterococcus sp. AZ196]|uniref:sucrose-6-phosphate hydrolase n=1 Tax=Enterococcus sp. AZ196 TaxID=2774659 RepID=UPI003D2B91AB